MPLEKVLVIGLDGATFDIIMPLIEEGKLPTFRKIMKSGVFSRLISVIPTNSVSAWSSFATGKNPAKHGVFYFEEILPSPYELERGPLATSKSINGETLWCILSRHGKKVGIVNVPLTYPPEEVNGFLISGFPIPAVADNFTFPYDLKEKIRGYETQMHVHNVFAKNYDEFRNNSFNLARKQGKVALELIEKYDWTFFMVVSRLPDNIQHFFWHFVDPYHPQFNPKDAEKYGNVISECYEEVDKMIGMILAKVGKRTNLVLVSDHGFGRHATRSVDLNYWLRDMKLLKLKRGSRDAMILRLFSIAKRFLASPLLRLLLMVPLFSRLRENVEYPLFKKPSRFIDWSQTKAFKFGEGVRINVKGKMPRGLVDPKTEYEELRSFIINKLDNLRDPETGKKIVKEVYKREDLYSGPFVDLTPDIVILPEEDYKLSSIMGDKLVYPAPAIHVTGDHKIDGIFLMIGPDVKEGDRIENVKITDVAPTILHLLDIPIPDDMDGRVLKEAFKPTSKPVKAKIKFQPPSKVRVKDYRWTREEEEEVKRRLKSLGYIE